MIVGAYRRAIAKTAGFTILSIIMLLSMFIPCKKLKAKVPMSSLANWARSAASELISFDLFRSQYRFDSIFFTYLRRKYFPYYP